jgi:hypothetical protein
MSSPTRVPLVWHTFDLREELPPDWQEEIHEVVTQRVLDSVLVPTSVTSREADAEPLPVSTVDGHALADKVPWLSALYHGRFRELAQQLTPEPVATAADPQYGVNLNVQRGTQMRYELHVDSNPIQGLLYCTTHLPGDGGELVISNLGDVSGRAYVDKDATRIYPLAGYLVFFDARAHTHYVSPLSSPDGVRIVAAMNFYTSSSPESARPDDLNAHLFGVN